ncbi:N-acetylmuramoyl-L-alanine amidase [Streptomyces sp. SID13726]|uniref:N-acetylmuramoyl-L-alanine amidase n=1 Tax=Streptomyces sp. SID13726 TaxID=2706058 RepID=UPI0013B5F91A|nr:N-acetylmuramoyl-L-alanine amidase [Streptomyces sp. SID13726]NEA98919.1 N-acetylmuramoyl-L-alanine amidase [Streptomyces sp. SID13726]
MSNTTPMTAAQLLSALRAEGLRISEHAGWRSHHRPGNWAPMNGVLIHHTGGNPPSDLNVVWHGRPDLPGPLCHCYLAKNGVATMISCGRANHAGAGDAEVYRQVVRENYGDRPSRPVKDSIDGNTHFYGLEISHPGNGQAFPPAQYQAAVRWAAAICRHYRWTAKSVIGHSEWTKRKSDPGFDMVRFRKDVQAQLNHRGLASAADDIVVPLSEGAVASGEVESPMADLP